MPWTPRTGASPLPTTDSGGWMERLLSGIAPQEGEGFITANPVKNFLNIVGTPAAAVTSSLKELTDIGGGETAAGARAQVDTPSAADWWNQISRPHMRLGVGDLLSSRDRTFGFDNPFKPGRINSNPFLRAGAIGLGFAGDILTDPLSYVGAPGAHAMKAGGRRRLAQTAAANHTEYALEIGVKRGDSEAIRLSNEVAAARNVYDESVRQFRRANDVDARAEWLARSKDAETSANLIRGEATAYVNTSGLGAELDTAIHSLARPGGGAAELADDATMRVLLGVRDGANIGGLRLRPFWRTEGGRQLITPELWRKVTGPTRELRGQIGQSRVGEAVRSRFGRSKNATLIRMANETARSGNPQLFRQKLGLLQDSQATDQLVYSWKETATSSVAALRAGRRLSPAQKAAVVSAVETPVADWEHYGIRAQLETSGMDVATVNGLEDLFTRWRQDGVSAGIEMGDLAQVYLPVRLSRAKLEEAGTNFAVAAQAAFERTRWVGTEYLGRELQSMNAMRAAGVVTVDETTGAVTIVDADAFQWDRFHRELDDINRDVYGDAYDADLFEKDPFALADIYIGEMGRRLQAEGYKAALIRNGLGVWGDDIANSEALGEALDAIPGLRTQRDEVASVYASAAEGAATAGQAWRQGPLFGQEQQAAATQRDVLKGLDELTRGVRTTANSELRAPMYALRNFVKEFQKKKGGIELSDAQRDAAEQMLATLDDADQLSVLREVGAEKQARLLSEAQRVGESLLVWPETPGGATDPVAAAAIKGLRRLTQRVLDASSTISDTLEAAVDGDDIATALSELDGMSQLWSGHLREYQTLRGLMSEQQAEEWLTELGAVEQTLLGINERVGTLGRELRGEMIGARIEQLPQSTINAAVDALLAARRHRSGIAAEFRRLPRERSQTQVANDLGLRSYELKALAPDELEVHPRYMQVRRNVTAEGVTERLESKVWSPLAAGSLVVWRRTDGSLWVVDGHHRAELAKRLHAEGRVDQFGDPIQLPAKIFNEDQGNDLQRMYLYGALVNLGEGRLDEVTLGLAMRTAPPEFADLLDDLVPKNRAGGIVNTATALSRLGEEAWRKAEILWDSGTPQYHTVAGRRVGDSEMRQMTGAERSALRKFDPRQNMNQLRKIPDVTDDPVMQAALVDSVVAAGLRGAAEADQFVERAVRTGILVEEQSMFGSQAGLSLAQLRGEAQIVNSIGNDLKAAKGALTRGLRGADILEQVEGTQIARAATADHTDVLEMSRRAWEFDSQHDPETLEMISRLAERVTAGELTMSGAVAEGATEYAARLRAEIEAGGIEKVNVGGATFWRSPIVERRQTQAMAVRAAADNAAAQQPSAAGSDLFGDASQPPPQSVVDVPEEPARMMVEGQENMFGEAPAPTARSGRDIAREVMDATPGEQRGLQREAAELGVNEEFADAMNELRAISATWDTPAKFAQWYHTSPPNEIDTILQRVDFPAEFAADIRSGDWDKVATWWPAEARQRAPIPVGAELAELRRPQLVAQLKAAAAAENAAAAELEAAAANPQILSQPTDRMLTDRELASRVRQAVTISSPERAAFDEFIGVDAHSALAHSDETAKSRFHLGADGENLRFLMDEIEADEAASPTPAGAGALAEAREAMAMVEAAGSISRSLPLQDRAKAAELFNTAVNANMAHARRLHFDDKFQAAANAAGRLNTLDDELRLLENNISVWARNEPQVRAFIDEAGGKIVNWQGVHTHDDIADMFELALQPQKVPTLVQSWSGFAGWWRGMALLSGGYHTRNHISGVVSNMFAGVPAATQRRAITEYVRMVRNQPVQDEPMRAFMEEAFQHGTFGRGQFGGEIRNVDASDTSWNPLAGLGNVTRPFRRGQERAQQWKPVHYNRIVGNHIENTLRAAAGFHAAQQAPRSAGAAGRQAAAQNLINKLHFDYTDLSNLEANYIRNVSMFWTWMSRNLMLQAEMAVHRPQLLSAVDRLFRNIGAGAPVNPYAPEYYSENEYRQITQRWYSTLEIPALAAMRDVNKVTNVVTGGGGQAGRGTAALRAVSEYSPFMREGIELLTGRDAMRGYELRGSEQAKRAAGSILPVYARFRRLAPQLLGGSEAEKERQLSSVFGWLGIPIRQASMSEMRYQRRLREDMVRGWEAETRRRDELRERERVRRTAAEDRRIESELAAFAPA